MSFAGEILALVGLLVITAVYFYNKWTSDIEKKLKWMKSPPHLPVLGHALEFKDCSIFHATLMKYINLLKEDYYIRIGVEYYAILWDYRSLELILSSNKILTKSLSYKFLEPWLATGLLTSTGQKWKQRRRILVPAFHFSILNQFIPVFNAEAQKLVKKLERTCGKDSIDVYPFVTMCTLDIIYETAMGVKINAQDNPESDYVKSINTMLRIITERTFSATGPYEFLYQFTKNYSDEKKALKILHECTDSVIIKRREELIKQGANKNGFVNEDGTKRKMAFLDLLLQSTVDGQPLSNLDIREEVDTFMFEGHDTTASGISFCLYCIANASPDIKEKIIEEQVKIYGDDKDRLTTYQDLQEMKYLENVIKESLRLYPSVPTIGRTTEEDIEYEDGKFFPKGINLTMFIFGANRNPKYFADPERFDPSRFETYDGTNPYAYVPFSAGPRNCIGQKYAMMEMKSTISLVVRNFELHSAGPEFEPILQSEGVLKSKNGLHVKLTKRKWTV